MSMMNDVVHQIIALDQRAVKIKESSEARAEKIENDTKEEISKSRSHTLDRTKEDCNRNYDVEIKKAKSERDTTIADMHENLNQIRDQYEATKKENAQQVLEKLFKTV